MGTYEVRLLNPLCVVHNDTDGDDVPSGLITVGAYAEIRREATRWFCEQLQRHQVEFEVRRIDPVPTDPLADPE